MRRLILLRHAKSDRPPGVADLDRPLNPRGRQAAPRMGAYIAEAGLRPDHVLVSPSRRTLETWDAVRVPLDGNPGETIPALYEAYAAQILDVVRGAPDHAGTLLVVGHNPGLQDFATEVVGSGPKAERRRLATQFPTAALAVIDFEADHWADIAGGTGRLERFVKPKDLDPDADD
ncbi:SixA phosphatase family protein [Methylobacterium radiodurans]|uniref:Phosphoglycerate mutase n=1 Tax=Methylobacterium radiodurans TaxID=2202828 RepID=A0A2U8VRS3_9HYPH|nr:histidine phosphatase family protein [Methylobacterium radiodurans]AWN36407.1 phosphoglycerate mutase [Methylobacterium radiodurans]